MNSCLIDANLRVHYEGLGQVANQLVLPALERSKNYDRLTGYFTVDSLLTISDGLENLIRNNGTMRLVIGLHDVPEEILLAAGSKNTAASKKYTFLREQLLSNLASLSTEMQRDKIGVLAWLMKDGILEVRVADPVSDSGRNIFHVKRMIFSDKHGHRVTAVGSPNETVSGLEGNYEDLTVHFDWKTPEYTEAHINAFEAIWKNDRPDLSVFELDKDFADDLLEKVSRRGRPPLGEASSEPSTSTISNLVSAARMSVPLHAFNLAAARLYPHQERTLLDASSRWPIRVLLADEVGLGKTLEAGAVLSSLLKFGGAKRALLLAPASLTKQLQEEMANHFNLDFWVWDSGSKVFKDADGAVHSGKFSHPLQNGTPALQIVSAQLARGTRRRQSFFEDADILPDILLVDEAHSARLNPDHFGDFHPNLMWRLLDSAAGKIPHVLLMTATPMQMHPFEFHGLMKILGLTQHWASEDTYISSLNLIATLPENPNLQQASTLGKLLEESSRTLIGLPKYLTNTEAELWGKVRSLAGVSKASVAIWCQQNFASLRELLVKVHPAHQLVVRNTRTALKRMGYKFPEREFHSPSVAASSEMTAFFETLETYLDDGYGLVEASLDPKYANSLGFVKSAYRQRVASSLFAAQETLSRRLARIEGIETSRNFDSSEPDEDLDDVEDVDTITAIDIPDNPALNHAISVEKIHIKDLLSKIEKIPGGVISGDPKFAEALKAINVLEGASQILVFSRYVDTLNGFINYFETNCDDTLLSKGFGCYTGGESWLAIKEGKFAAGKKEITKALDLGKIQVLFCSDAASEGLNLQSASVLINLDIPWNPARLEQRIGRIARLGQKSDSVTILNLWYPDSIEAKMYRKLLERRDLYELAVGEFPEIFSKAIRDAVTNEDFEINDALNKVSSDVQKLRLDAQHVALNATWNVDIEPTPASKVFFDELEKALSLAQKSFNLRDAPGGRVVNLTDDRLDQLALVRSVKLKNPKKIYSVISGTAVLAFALELDDARKLLLPSEAFPDVLLAATDIEPFDTSKYGELKSFAEGDDLSLLLKNQRWLPDFQLISGNVDWNLDGEVTFSHLPSHPGSQTELQLLGSVSSKE